MLAQEYYFRADSAAARGNLAPGEEVASVALSAAGPFEATIGEAWDFDFSSVTSASGTGTTSWALDLSGAGLSVPQGVSLDGGSGLMSGIPDVEGEHDFEVVASHGDAEDREVYTIVVGGVTLDVVQISAGYNHTCAVDTGGNAWCWGSGIRGRLGNGDTTDQHTPTAVDMEPGSVSRIAAGGIHTCAVDTNGNAWCWGRNNYSQLGDGTTEDRHTPTAVDIEPGISVSHLSASTHHTCAAATDGNAWCWGRNNNGHLGDGTTEYRYTPTAVDMEPGSVSRIAAGHGYTCAVDTGGNAWCWGSNWKGQIGDGTTENRQTPTEVDIEPGSVSRIAAGGTHTCAVDTGGQAYCWGDNDDGQLGEGSTTDRGTPVEVELNPES